MKPKLLKEEDKYRKLNRFIHISCVNRNISNALYHKYIK